MLALISRGHVFLLSIILGFNLTTLIADPLCPDGWVIHKNMCYTVYEHFHVNLHDAIKICKSVSGDVPSLSSEDLQIFVNDWLLNKTNITSAWLSGQKATYNYLEHNKTGTLWFWHGDEVISYSKWHTGHPSSQLLHNCMALKNVFDSSNDGYEKYIWQDFYDWSSVLCTEKATVICVKKACPEDWEEFKGMCYKLFDGLKMTHNEASTHCKKMNASLIGISSLAENRFLTTFLSKCTTSFIWTSGKYLVQINTVRERKPNYYGNWEYVETKEEKATGPWLWEELNIKFGYTNWIKGHGSGGKNQCMNLQNRLAMNNDTLLEEYKWAQHSCDEKNTFICRKKP